VTAFFDYPTGAADSAPDRELVLLEQLSPTEWERLVDVMERRRCPAGSVVIARGDADGSLYLVSSGLVEILVPYGRRERVVREQGPGTVLGEVAFFDGKPRSVTVRAVTDSELLRLGHDAFEVLAARHPDLARKILLDLGRVLATRLRQAEARDGR
jgi:CRP/FNR family transcriptional regulator, cyclic AMP receptor protein